MAKLQRQIFSNSAHCVLCIVVVIFSRGTKITTPAQHNQITREVNIDSVDAESIGKRWMLALAAVRFEKDPLASWTNGINNYFVKLCNRVAKGFVHSPTDVTGPVTRPSSDTYTSQINNFFVKKVAIQIILNFVFF